MNPICPRCGAGCPTKHGRYRRADDAQFIQRYRCKACAKCFSSATFSATYRQKKRRLNRLIEMDIASSTAQRRIALKHGCDRKTVARKVKFLAKQAREKIQSLLSKAPLYTNLQWDELLTFEHTRLKPLSVAVMVCKETRQILAYGVAQIPASGLIAQRSREKYGPRPDLSGVMRGKTLSAIAPQIASTARIETDEHKRYANEISRILPEAVHVQYPSVRGSLTGQGELKRTGRDPLFTINHTLAMLRDNIKCLARRTWCTAKLAAALDDIVAIYVAYHNANLIPQQPRT